MKMSHELNRFFTYLVVAAIGLFFLWCIYLLIKRRFSGTVRIELATDIFHSNDNIRGLIRIFANQSLLIKTIEIVLWKREQLSHMGKHHRHTTKINIWRCGKWLVKEDDIQIYSKQTETVPFEIPPPEDLSLTKNLGDFAPLGSLDMKLPGQIKLLEHLRSSKSQRDISWYIEALVVCDNVELFGSSKNFLIKSQLNSGTQAPDKK